MAGCSPCTCSSSSTLGRFRGSTCSILFMASKSESLYLFGMRAKRPVLILTANDTTLAASKGGFNAASS
eukprot:CAMPEP_0173258822 /NCGR_PEP_ID=MMETSP1142-20121109/24605_1 /TAXON_ID=483371 /ORGANISM="non described non described, Strain CCMP2298" /LENGTH=68 /DNA_ID=CAMNT_0014193237 /DNA_START=25 /DNA_END=231 /DNA_ORIENTATION=-